MIVNNPFRSPLFWPTALRVVILLALATALVALVERRRLRQVQQSVLFQRCLSWAVMAPVFGLGVFLGGVVSIALITSLTLQGLREYAHLVALDPLYRRLLYGYSLVNIAVIIARPDLFKYLAGLFFLILTLAPIVTERVHGSYRQVTAALFGYMYLPLFLSFFVLIGRTEPSGTAILLLLGFAVALSDVMAYVIGRLLGGPRLAPQVSPNKTWAGALGNVVGAYAGFFLMAFAIPPQWPFNLRYGLPLVIAVGAVWGDLIESFIKREFAAKDAGTMLPGFGGLLDRIDSLVIALPLVYYAVKVFA